MWPRKRPSLLLSRTALLSSVIPVVQTVTGCHSICASHHEDLRLQLSIIVDRISMTLEKSITGDNAELNAESSARNVPKKPRPVGMDSESPDPKIGQPSISEALPHPKFFYQHDMITIRVCRLHIRTGIRGIIILNRWTMCSSAFRDTL
jgi:hypothetical protein